MTTEVAVCLTKLNVLFGTRAGWSREAASRVAARVSLIAVGVVSTPETFPNVTKRKRTALGELLHVAKLVQQECGIEPRSRREKDRASKSDRRDGRLSKQPSTDAWRKPAPPVVDFAELRPHSSDIFRELELAAEKRVT